MIGGPNFAIQFASDFATPDVLILLGFALVAKLTDAVEKRGFSSAQLRSEKRHDETHCERSRTIRIPRMEKYLTRVTRLITTFFRAALHACGQRSF